MAKFKVGDVVKVLDGSHITDYTGSWAHGKMDAYVGKSFKIRCVEGGYGDRVGYNLELGDDEPRWLTWDERGLELVEEYIDPVIHSVPESLKEIKELQMTCVVPTATRKQAEELIGYLGAGAGVLKDDLINSWDRYKEQTAYKIVRGKPVGFASKDYYSALGFSIHHITEWEDKMTHAFRFETKETERYQSEGKHKGKTIPTVTTIVYDDTMGNRGVATCDKDNYDERQGILEAVGNMIYGNFDREYNKFKARKKRISDLLCKCNTCGKTYKTQEEARACEKAHVERKKAKYEKYLLNKEAKRRIAEAEREGKINDLIRQLTRKK